MYFMQSNAFQVAMYVGGSGGGGDVGSVDWLHRARLRFRR
jgi:hypothetical protein